MKISKLPLNVDEFKAMRDELAVSPEGGAAMFVIALKMFVANPAEGVKCMIMQREMKYLDQNSGPNSYMGYALGNSELSLVKNQIGKQKYIPDSYFAGAIPQNNYTIPENSFELDISTNPYSGNAESGSIKLFIRSSGADTARPVAMTRNDKGLWKVAEYSSLIVGIRKAANEELKDNL